MHSPYPPFPESTAPAVVTAEAGAGNFPIVAIGASAGGLEALEKFIAPVPATAPQAFIVIQHLAPTHRPLLVSLLQRRSALPVSEAVDGTMVEPGQVYVIPPDRELSILNGVLLVAEPSQPRGHRLPIDVFMAALADDRGPNAIGVVLSGMGLDGSAGLRAIKQQGGGTFVQSPDSSQFDSMPRHAIAASVIDIVAAAEALYEEIARRPVVAVPTTWEGLDKVIHLVRTRTGHDFSHYKRSTLTRRIARRMQSHHLDSLDAYLRVLRTDASEADALFNTLLIGVTRFFRDTAAWDEMARTAVPALLAAHTGGGTLRAWVPGCSTGEEAYSLAILFREALTELSDLNINVQIFATDLDRTAIAKGRAAFYPASIAGDVSPERLRRFFVQEHGGYRVNKSIRECVILAPQNVVMDPPFTKLDLISCRNLLIYLTPELQQRLLQLFHYGLRAEGVLFLGSAETVGPHSPFFTPMVEAARIYRRTGASVVLQDLDFPRSFDRVPTGDRHAGKNAGQDGQLRALMEEMILQRFAPTALVVTSDGTTLQALGDLPRFFGPSADHLSALKLGTSGSVLASAIIAGLHTALAERRSVLLDDLDVPQDDGVMRVRIALAPIEAAAAPEGTCLVVLHEVTADGGASALAATDGASRAGRERDALWRRLERARQDTLSSQQELRAANEELQSANEELTSSKEEMQSMNEELQTVNHELQAKLDELTLASNDMTNLLNSTSIATLFLDAQLNVRRFTTPTTRIIRLIPSDVGRPVTDLVSALEFPDMVDVAREVLRTLVAFEQTLPASGGRWFNVRIMPYRTQDDHIDGLVLTFTDATEAKTLEAALRAAQAKLEAKLATRVDTPLPKPPPGSSS